MSLIELDGGWKPDSHLDSELRINVNSNLCRWFNRNLGLWRSRRQYFFEHDEVLTVDMMLRMQVFAQKSNGENRYLFTWWPENEGDFFNKKPSYSKEGKMEATLDGHQLQRSNSYFDNSTGRSNIRQVDEHEVIFESTFGSWNVIEHTRLIDQDRYRSRVIYSWNNDNLKIVEHHHESRIEWGSEPLIDS